MENGAKTEAGSWSFLQIDEENILADTVKKAEDGDDLILRFYEAYGMRTKVRLTLPLLASGFGAAICDLMEETEPGKIAADQEKTLIQKGSSLEFEMKPYEITSIRLQWNRKI